MVCPLGRLLPAAARSGSTPNSGRVRTYLSTWVLTFAPAISSVAVTASALRPRISAMKPITAVAASNDTTDMALRMVSTGPSTRSWPIWLPVRATVSSHCPSSVCTANRHTTRNAAVWTKASTTNQTAVQPLAVSRTRTT